MTTSETLLSIFIILSTIFAPGIIAYFATRYIMKKKSKKEPEILQPICLMFVPIIIGLSLAVTSFFVEKVTVSTSYELIDVTYKNTDFVLVEYETPEHEMMIEVEYHVGLFEMNPQNKSCFIIKTTCPTNKIAKLFYPPSNEYTISLSEEDLGLFLKKSSES